MLIRESSDLGKGSMSDGDASDANQSTMRRALKSREVEALFESQEPADQRLISMVGQKEEKKLDNKAQSDQPKNLRSVNVRKMPAINRPHKVMWPSSELCEE